MINVEFLSAAKKQLAADYACAPEDFFADVNIVTAAVSAEGQRKFTDRPPAFRAATFGKNTLISAVPELLEVVQELSSIGGTKLFDGSGIAAANGILAPYGHVIGMISQYYLPSAEFLPRDFGGYDLRLFGEREILEILYPYYGGYENALMYGSRGDRRDVLAVCAVNGKEILGMAGVSSDSELFWQIGIDILPEHRGKGLAPILVSTLANEVILRGKIPYYGTWSGNIISQRTALGSGFLPAWTEMCSVPIE